MFDPEQDDHPMSWLLGQMTPALSPALHQWLSEFENLPTGDVMPDYGSPKNMANDVYIIYLNKPQQHVKLGALWTIYLSIKQPNPEPWIPGADPDKEIRSPSPRLHSQDALRRPANVGGLADPCSQHLGYWV